MPRKKKTTTENLLADATSVVDVTGFDYTLKPYEEGVTIVTMIADPQVDDEALEDANEVDLDKLQTDFMFRGPVNLRLLVESQAEDAGLNPSQYLRKIVANAVGYKLQSNSARSSMSDEEKARRQEELKAKAKAERARVKALLQQARGEVSTGK